MERPLPLPAPSSSAISTAGRWNRSTMRDATIPTTPACHPSRASTSPRAPASTRARASSIASSRMRRSISCRAAFSRSSSSASARAVPSSSARRSRTPRPASSSRPAALMRGASRKPTWPAVISPPSAIPATRFSARSPGRRLVAIASSPQRTRIRFAPTSGTTSATVPSATRSSASFRFGSGARHAEATALAEPPPERHHERERDADGGEPLRRIGAAGLVRVQDRARGGQLDRDGVVIDHHRVEAERRRRAHLLDARDAAVERDEEPSAVRGELANRLRVEAVPLDEPVRGVRDDVRALRRGGTRRGARSR